MIQKYWLLNAEYNPYKPIMQDNWSRLYTELVLPQ